jgi:anti-sigma-K factor RskA
VAAAVIALVASLGFNATLIGRKDRAERDAKALSAVVQLASDPATRSVTLRGQSGGMVLLYQPGGKATLIASNVGSPPSGKLFELWLIKDGRPQPVLTFKPERGSVVLAVPINPATFRGVAVTIEEGLVQAPTNEPVYAGSIEA